MSVVEMASSAPEGCEMRSREGLVVKSGWRDRRWLEASYHLDRPSNSQCSLHDGHLRHGFVNLQYSLTNQTLPHMEFRMDLNINPMMLQGVSVDHEAHCFQGGCQDIECHPTWMQIRHTC
jgi:hypothetical protein